MIALSMLSESLGRPSSSQLRMATGSPSTPTILKLALQGMEADLQHHTTHTRAELLMHHDA
jgi:hypothetical protein